MNDHLTNISKYISLVLRHRPDKIGLKLDKEGWAFVSELCLKAGVSKSDLCKVVEQNSKQRFAFNGDKSKIRASQGHSINVDLKLAEIKPPMFLYHGTAVQFLTDIR